MSGDIVDGGEGEEEEPSPTPTTMKIDGDEIAVWDWGEMWEENDPPLYYHEDGEERMLVEIAIRGFGDADKSVEKVTTGKWEIPAKGEVVEIEGPRGRRFTGRHIVTVVKNGGMGSVFSVLSDLGNRT